MRPIDAGHLVQAPAKWTPVRRQEHGPLNEPRACPDSNRAEPASESKYLGLATVAITSLGTFGTMGTNGWIALALSGAFIGAYWFIYGEQ
jgi:hypothetical protein